MAYGHHPKPALPSHIMVPPKDCPLYCCLVDIRYIGQVTQEFYFYSRYTKIVTWKTNLKKEHFSVTHGWVLPTFTVWLHSVCVCAVHGSPIVWNPQVLKMWCQPQLWFHFLAKCSVRLWHFPAGRKDNKMMTAGFCFLFWLLESKKHRSAG